MLGVMRGLQREEVTVGCKKLQGEEYYCHTLHQIVPGR